jgi:hypothetical protein
MVLLGPFRAGPAVRDLSRVSVRRGASILSKLGSDTELLTPLHPMLPLLPAGPGGDFRRGPLGPEGGAGPVGPAGWKGPSARPAGTIH